MKKTFPAIALIAIVALTAAGCGSSGDNSGSGSGGAYGGGESSDTTSSTGGTAAVITSANAKGVGRVLVDSKGFTVYDFHKDKGGKSSCYGACAKGWPPMLTEGKPQTGEGAMASKLGTVERNDGTVQVTYAGHPLYTFVEDKSPGEANGNDVSAFGAQWYALRSSGEEAGD